MAKNLKETGTRVKLDKADMFIRGFTYVFTSLFALCCLFPFLLIVMSSFATEESIRRTGFTIWPSDFTTYSYELIFKAPDMMIGSYLVTIGMTLSGTVVGLFIIAMTGYALQRRDFPYRNKISFYITLDLFHGAVRAIDSINVLFAVYVAQRHLCAERRADGQNILFHDCF